MISQFGFHRRRDPECLVNPAEVVVGKVQAVSGPQVLPPLTERVRQAGVSAHLHPEREILAFHDAGANPFGIGLSDNWYHVLGSDFSR